MTEAALVEGQVKLRDGKKVGAAAGAGRGGRGRRLTLSLSPQWKTRWLVLRKPSPVAGERARGAGAGSGAPRARSAAGGLLRAPGRPGAPASSPEIAGSGRPGARAVTGERPGLGLRGPSWRPDSARSPEVVSDPRSLGRPPLAGGLTVPQRDLGGLGEPWRREG